MARLLVSGVATTRYPEIDRISDTESIDQWPMSD
jgi:hypothetical protein